MNQKSQQGGVNKFVKLKGYHSYKFRKISIFILPIFCFILEKDCYSYAKEAVQKMQNVYNRYKNQLENSTNPVYDAFRLTPEYKICISLSFDSDDDDEITRNVDKLRECIKNFDEHTNKYLQKDFSEAVEKELNEMLMFGGNFKCTRDKDFYYWCKNGEYKCYSSYNPNNRYPFVTGSCDSISEQSNNSSSSSNNKLYEDFRAKTRIPKYTDSRETNKQLDAINKFLRINPLTSTGPVSHTDLGNGDFIVEHNGETTKVHVDENNNVTLLK